MDATKVLGKALVASPERRQEADADLEIVRQVQAGDVAAFDRLISKYRERVFGIIYNMTSNREDAADLTQDAYQGVSIDSALWRPVVVFHLALSHRRQFHAEPSAQIPAAVVFQLGTHQYRR